MRNAAGCGLGVSAFGRDPRATWTFQFRIASRVASLSRRLSSASTGLPRTLMLCLGWRRSRSVSVSATMPQAGGDAQQPRRGLLYRIFGYCFPNLMAQPYSLTPGTQSPSEASPLLINGPPPSSFTAQSPAPDDMSSPRSSDPLQGPPSQPPQTSEDTQRSGPADRLKGALGITYDVAKIVAGNFPLPGLQSMIGLVDYIRTLREVRYKDFIALSVLD